VRPTRPWDKLPPKTKRVIMETALIPLAVLVATVTPSMILYFRDPSPANTALLVVAVAALYAILAALVWRLLTELKQAPSSPASPPK